MKENKKNEELNFLYLDEKYIEKKPKNKTKRADKKSAQKKKRNKKDKKIEDDIFNFNNEIIIGVTRTDTQNKIEKKSKEKVQNKKTKKPEKQIKSKTKIKKDNTKKKKSIVGKIIKWTIILIALIVAAIFFVMSPVFDLIQIDVLNNNKISKETIISLSQIQIGQNIYKTSKKTIKKNIKQNSYVEDVKITRKLPNKIEITVKERKPTYMLQYANSYVYINNQGYILEISQEALQVPIIVGNVTQEEKYSSIHRLEEEDLKKLETVLKIMESAISNGIDAFITKIDISDKQNYKLILEQEKKTVHIGDGSDLSNRMLYIKSILNTEKGIEGEIFVNGDLNKERVFFREKI